MHPIRISRALAAAAALALVAAGCGGDGPATQRAASTTAAGDATKADGAGGTLPLKRRAVSPFVDYGTSRQSQPTKVGVRVLAVRKGRTADLAQFDLGREHRRSVPYYVDAEFENLGRFALSRNLLRASMEDKEGREHRPSTLVVLGGTFRACPETPRAPLRPGRRFTACSPILLPKGTKPGRVRFQGDVTKDPLFWAAR